MKYANFGLAQNLRRMSVAELKKLDRYDLSETKDKPIVIEHRGETIAVLMDYNEFIAMQMALVVGLEALERVREPLAVVRKSEINQ